ncbi:MAG: nucleotidyltransferase domain-containing protein [Acidobacteriota bacterium]
MPLQNRLRKILQEYRALLTGVLGEDLKFIVLYGSQARGDAEAGSDIDVLCVMRGPFDYGGLIERTSQASAQISLRYEVVISIAFVTIDDYRTRGTPFLMNVRREGVAV